MFWSNAQHIEANINGSFNIYRFIWNHCIYRS